MLSWIELKPDSRYLEIGCGPGYLWQSNRRSLPPGCQITLTDISPGMLSEARSALETHAGFIFAEADAASLPFADNHFHGAIANHMLYHVRSLPEALGELQRVLKPSACLYAATNGRSHLKEIREWKADFSPSNDASQWGTTADSFSLENGRDLLSRWFSKIELRTYLDHLEVTETGPIIRYIESYDKQGLDPQAIKELTSYLESILSEQGSIRISKSSGMFIAKKE